MAVHSVGTPLAYPRARICATDAGAKPRMKDEGGRMKGRHLCFPSPFRLHPSSFQRPARLPLAVLFFQPVARLEQARLRLEAQRAAAQGDVALRAGNLDALFEEEAADVVIDGALDDEVAARAVRPDGQAEVE